MDVLNGTDGQGNALELDYKAIVEQWNTKLVDAAVPQRFETLTAKKPHRC